MSVYDAPNQQVVRGDGSAPWEEGTGGSSPEADSAPVPKTHVELDALAEEQGHEWSEEGLTIAQKRTELGV